MDANQLYLRFSESEYACRYASARSAMAETGLSALVLYGTVSAYHAVLYLSNFATMREAMLIFPIEGEPTLFVQYFNHVPNARLVASLADVRWGGPDIALAAVENLRERALTGDRPPQPFTFRENMVVVIQPNVITPDERMGVQVGELVRVTPNGVESLHSYPMRFIQCG